MKICERRPPTRATVNRCRLQVCPRHLEGRQGTAAASPAPPLRHFSLSSRLFLSPLCLSLALSRCRTTTSSRRRRSRSRRCPRATRRTRTSTSASAPRCGSHARYSFGGRRATSDTPCSTLWPPCPHECSNMWPGRGAVRCGVHAVRASPTCRPVLRRRHLGRRQHRPGAAHANRVWRRLLKVGL